MSTSDPQAKSKAQTKNYSLLAIPIAYALVYPPHIFQFYRGMTASNYAATNAYPRTNLEILREKVPSATYKSLVRAQGAHLNALEGFPLFAAAMVCILLFPSSTFTCPFSMRTRVPPERYADTLNLACRKLRPRPGR